MSKSRTLDFLPIMFFEKQNAPSPVLPEPKLSSGRASISTFPPSPRIASVRRKALKKPFSQLSAPALLVSSCPANIPKCVSPT